MRSYKHANTPFMTEKDLITEAAKILTEATTPDTTITVTARDPDSNLAKLLTCIKNVGGVGHSFSIVVDPDEPRGLSERKFFWDGDGADRIVDIDVK